MKSLVIYYTASGNTEVVAQEIAKQTGSDLKKIEELKPRSTSNMAGPAISAIFGRKSKLKETDLSLEGYDTIYLGGQVWAGHSTPAINAFLQEANFSGKTVFLFLTCADGKEPSGVIQSIKTRIEKQGGKLGGSFFLQTKMNSLIPQQSVEQPVSDWIQRIGSPAK